MQKGASPRTHFEKYEPLTELSAVNLAGTKATRANSNGLRSTVNDCLYLTDIGLPGSVGLTVRVRNVLTENNTFSTNTALCHDFTSLQFLAIY